MAEFQWSGLGTNVDAIIATLTGAKPATEADAAARAAMPIPPLYFVLGGLILLWVLVKK